MWMLGSQHPLLDGQETLIERCAFAFSLLILVKCCERTERIDQRRVVATQETFLDAEHLLGQVLSLFIPFLFAVQPSQLAQTL